LTILRQLLLKLDEYSSVLFGTSFAFSIGFDGGYMRSEREGRGSLKAQPPNAVVAHEEIAGRAYKRYLERGSTDGHDIDDWLAAEQELARERTASQPSRRPKVPKPEAA
jgi:hypothetical protein